MASVILVGCGCPLRSMGWYHATQLLDQRVEGATLTHIVEPWYLSKAAKDSPGCDEFMQWKDEQEDKHGILFYSTVSELSEALAKEKASESMVRLVILSARTADNPHLFHDCLEKIPNCKAMFLEKPGAPTVQELETMNQQAQARNMPVYMGFNKNVSPYVAQARALANEQSDASTLTFIHNNNFSPDTLAECFERNAEGMLKNMAIHELALLVTYYGVAVDTIQDVSADPEYSSCQTLTGPFSGKDFTDFDKLKFEIITKSGNSIWVAADRCGGDESLGIVSQRRDGQELGRFAMPDADAVSKVPYWKARYGDAMPYFFTQDADYCKLKQLVVDHLLKGTTIEGVATLPVALETLKVAEYLTPILQKQLLKA